MPTQVTLAKELMRLHRRISSFYEALNEKNWEMCFALVDPKLREERIDHDAYVDSLSDFFDKYGPIGIEGIEQLKPFLNATKNNYGGRPFAHGLVRWQDKRQNRHVFRERWVKSHGTWYTRMIGLA